MVNHPPTSRISASIIRCIACGYDLTGTTIGGVCPECGASVEKSVVSQSKGLSSGKATACMVLGILSIAACPGFAPIALGLYIAARKQMSVGGYEQSSHTMAKAGLIMGIIGCAILGLYVLIFGLGFVLH